MSRTMNFNAGPAALPLSALERAKAELLDFEGSGMSLMEHSHRGKIYERVHDEAIGLVKKLLGIGDDWEVLFVQGGASMAFAQIPLNLLAEGARCEYVVTGAWGEKAVAEANVVAKLTGGAVDVVATTAINGSYVSVPRATEIRATDGAAYLHLTSNETIHGVQWALSDSTSFPRPVSPLVCDMSSDILGRVVDATAFSVIYAGAQKNLGPSGVTLVCARKETIARGRKDIPVIWQYRTHAENRSLYNTPPTFGIYLMRNVLAWLDAEGGTPAIEARNRKKAKLVYDAIEGSGGFYRCPVEVPSRSIMNVVWRLPTPALEDQFVKEADAAKMVGLKGHRSVGGIRASLYNAVELGWCEALAGFMKDFAARRG